jgi:hypothetical protein
MSSSKNVSGKKFMECLRLALDEENEYVIDDIKKLAVNAFKEANC